MRQVSDYIWVGSDEDCTKVDKNRKFRLSVIHACKSCHQKALKYTKSLSPDNPNYLFYEDGEDLYLNMIDPPKPLFKVELFSRAVSFLDRHPGGVLIHCNEGFSRAPSIALVYLAGWGEIPNGSYNEARKAYVGIDIEYRPGEGIVEFLTKNWQAVATRGDLK